MSYLIEGPVFLLVGLFLLLIVPLGGITVIVISIMIIVTALREQKPGSKPGLCSVLGHDWRTDLPGHKGARVCRNCLKGAQLNYGAPAYYGAPVIYGVPGGPGYGSYPSYPGFAPAPPPPGYVAPDPYPPRPGYTGATAPYVLPPAAPPAAPPPTKYAAMAVPMRPRYCQNCGLGVPEGTRTCPHCGQPA